MPDLKRKRSDGDDDAEALLRTTGRSVRAKLLPRAPLEIKRAAGLDISGNKFARVIMGMCAPFSANSKTADSVIVKARVKVLNTAAGSIKFIVGHLINEQFPRKLGDRNFVVLTVPANSAHKGQVETKLARFLTVVNGGQGDAFNRMLDEKHLFGICYTVTASSDCWDGDIPKLVRWTLKLDVYDIDTKLIVPNIYVEELNSLRAFALRITGIKGIDKIAGASGEFGNTIRL